MLHYHNINSYMIYGKHFEIIYANHILFLLKFRVNFKTCNFITMLNIMM